MRLSRFVSRCVASRIAAVVCLLTALLLPAAASAQTCTVTSTVDSAAAITTVGTLRYCAENALTYSTIDLSTLPPLSVITLSGPLGISGVAASQVVLHGPANGGVTIAGGSTTQSIDNQNNVTISFDHLVFQNVTLVVGSGYLKLTDVTVFGVTSSSGAAVNAEGITLNNSTITGNAGGGISGPGLYVTQSTVYGNASFDIRAFVGVQGSIKQSIVGAISGPTLTQTNSYVGTAAQLGPLQLNGSLFPTMLPLVGSPGIGMAGTTTADERGFPGKSTGDAGAVQTNYITVTSLGDAANSNCTASSCTLRQAINTANLAMGGDITLGSLASAASPGTITLTSALPNITSLVDVAGPGANALSVSGAGNYKITTILTGGSLAFNGLTATAANGYPSGAALMNSGLLTLAHSAVTATKGGSAIYGLNSSSGTVAAVISASTISGNNGQDDTGGIYSFAALRILDSTFSGNTSANGAGGGINQSSATLFIAGSTISANSPSPGLPGAGIYIQPTATATIANSIVEGNSTGGAYPDLVGSYTDAGGNSVNTTQGATLNPGLGPLAYNGGTTQTMLPLPGSPAICAGSAANGLAYGTTTDERGATHAAYCRTTELDAGAVQTSYSKLAFVQQPANTQAYETLNPAPTLALMEDNTDAGSVPLTVTATGANTLAGTPIETTAPGSVATFLDLYFNDISIDNTETLSSSTTITPAGYSGTQFILLSGNSASFLITGPPSNSRSSLVLSPSTIAVQGTSMATLTVKDMGGYTISGAAVQINSSNTSVATVPSTGTTGADGTATFSVAGKGPGSAIIAVSNPDLSLAATFVVTGPPSSATSTLIATPSLLDVGSTSTVTATVEDAGGNPVPNATVSVSFTSASAPVTVTEGGMTSQFAAGQAGSFGGTTNASGQVVYSLTAGAPTKVTMTGTAGNTAGNFSFTQTPVVTFVQPSYLVTTSMDDPAGVPGNCADQATNLGGTNTNCSLRDAIAAANAEGAGAVANITFSQALLTGSPVTITEGSGGTLYISNGMTIQGLSGTPGQVSVSGANKYGVFDVNPVTGAGAVMFNSLTITKAGGTNSYGGIDVEGGAVTVAGSTISGNAGIESGGMLLEGGSVTVTGSTISGNTASGNGGGIGVTGGSTVVVMGSTISGNTTLASAGQGGGISVGQGTVTVTGSTISGNSAPLGNGGGITARGVGNIILTDSTLSGNSAGVGGGIYADGIVSVRSSTISGNSASTQGNGIFYAGGSLSMSNTLIPDSVNYTPTGNLGNVTSGANLSGLGNFGGTTQTIFPLPGSAAICGGLTVDIPTGLTTDQRGAARTTPYGTTTCVDAGAVQTHYALAFATQPSSVLTNTSMSPAPAVALSENGVAFNVASETLPLMLSGNGTLSGGSASTSTTSGIATYNALQVSGAGTGDTLTANLVLNASPATAIATTSSAFNVAAQAPTVSSITPNNGAATGGTTVTITGANFTSGSTVQFGSTSASSVTINSSTSLTATSPAGVPGTVNVTVATPAGTTTLSAAFTYVGPTAYLVTTLTDDAKGVVTNCIPAATSNAAPNNNCSLRDAIAAVNLLPSGVTGTINFYSALFASATRTNPAVYAISTNGSLNITGAVTINGPTGSDAGGTFDKLAIDGTGGNSGIFFLSPGSSVDAINQLIIRNGSASSGSSAGGGIALTSGTLTVTGCTLTGNSAVNTGGGILVMNANLTLTGSLLSGNSVPRYLGGGIFILNGTVTINGSTVSGNSALISGGVYSADSNLIVTGSTVSGNSGQAGAGILSNGGRLTVTGSTISGNSSSTYGGGISTNGGDLSVTGSTLSGNTATSSGGGIYLSGGALTVTGSTISGNAAASGSGIFAEASNGITLTLRNTLIPDSVVGSTVATGQGNVITSGNLSPLGNYGGPTQTILPLPGSAAFCAGLVSAANGAPANNQAYTDQRGATHSVAYCTASQLDAGAVQTSYSLGNGFTVNPPSTVMPRSAINPAPAVVLTENGSVSSGDPVVLSAASGTLSGQTTASSGTNGIATFSGVSITGASPGDTLTATLNLGPVAGAPQLTVTSTPFSATTLSPSMLAGGTVGVPYSQTLSVSGSSGAYTYSINAGALPAGLTLGVSTGTISGTPTAGGSFTFSVSASNGGVIAATQSYTVAIAGATVTLAPATLSAFTVRMQTSVTLTASGGTAPYTYASNGTLPPGLTLNTTTGVLSGSPTAGGSYTFTITANDNSAGTGPYSGSLSYTATVGAATATVNVAAATATYGAATVPLSATVTFSAGVTPTGAFSFQAGSNPSLVATCTAASSTTETCTASYPLTGLGAGRYTVTGTLAADKNYGQSSSTNTLTVSPAATTETVSPVTVVYGTASVTLTAQMAYSGAIAPTGGLTFTVNGSATGVAAVSCTGSSSPLTCKASYNTAALAVNNYAIMATEAADTNYTTSSGMGTLTITRAMPVITVANQSVAYGTSSATLSAMVTYSGGVPSGALTFTVDGGNPVTAACSASASPETCTVTYTTASLTAGTHTITAIISADANYTAASAMGTLTVSTVGPTIAFAVPNHAYGDAPFAVTATSNSTGAFTYTVVSGNATISGNVVSLTGIGTVVLQASEAADSNYTAGSRQTSFVVAPATLTVSANSTTRYYGAANPAFTGTVTGQRYNDTFTESFATNPAANSTSAPGAYGIVPAAAGTNLDDYTVTTVNGTLTIAQAPTGATLTASAATLNPNQPVTLTATVASSTSGLPTGTVTFYDNGTALGTATLLNGTVNYITTLPPASSNTLTLSYMGDADFLPSNSGGAVTVSVTPLSFKFTDTGVAALTEAPGKVAVYTFQLSPDFGSYASAVTFSVTGLPPGATATFTPSSVAAGGGVQAVVMSVQTRQALAREQAPASPFGPRQMPLLALLLLPLLGNRKTRRKLGSRLLVVLLMAGGLAAVTGITGCGSGNGFLLEQPATYTLIVTATAGTLQQSQTVTLKVQ